MLELRKVYDFHFLYNILREMMPEEKHIAVKYPLQNDWKNLLNKFGQVEQTLGSPTISYWHNTERIHDRRIINKL